MKKNLLKVGLTVVVTIAITVGVTVPITINFNRLSNVKNKNEMNITVDGSSYQVTSDTIVDLATKNGELSSRNIQLEAENEELKSEIENKNKEIEEIKKEIIENDNVAKENDVKENVVEKSSDFLETIYDGIHFTIYGIDESVQSFQIGGTEYYSGVTLYGGWDGDQNEGNILCNLGGKYSKLTFDVGRVDETSITEGKLIVLGDQKILKNYDINPEKSLENIEVVIDGVQDLKIQIQSTYSTYGIVNCELL